MLSADQLSTMTRAALSDYAETQNVYLPGRTRKAILARLVEWTEWALATKPFKVVELVDRSEISRIQGEAERSPVNINDWRDSRIAELQDADQERLLSEHADRADADKDAADRNRHARHGFSYHVETIDATLADLRS